MCAEILVFNMGSVTRNYLLVCHTDPQGGLKFLISSHFQHFDQLFCLEHQIFVLKTIRALFPLKELSKTSELRWILGARIVRIYHHPFSPTPSMENPIFPPLFIMITDTNTYIRILLKHSHFNKMLSYFSLIWMAFCAFSFFTQIETSQTNYLITLFAQGLFVYSLIWYSLVFN